MPSGLDQDGLGAEGSRCPPREGATAPPPTPAARNGGRRGTHCVPGSRVTGAQLVEVVPRGGPCVPLTVHAAPLRPACAGPTLPPRGCAQRGEGGPATPSGTLASPTENQASPFRLAPHILHMEPVIQGPPLSGVGAPAHALACLLCRETPPTGCVLSTLAALGKPCRPLEAPGFAGLEHRRTGVFGGLASLLLHWPRSAPATHRPHPGVSRDQAWGP